jgi:putative nucleotidyltransferase with HDIG domain
MYKIGDTTYLKQGNHLVLLYEKNEEMINIMHDYLINCLLNNEKCIYVDSDDEKELILSTIDKDIDSMKYLEKGQLVFLEKSKAYSEGGEFKPDKMIQLLKKMSLEAISEGYEGIAITGELSWVLKYGDGIERIIEYEWKLNEDIFGKFPVSAICRYNMSRFSDETLINVIQLHPFIIYKGKVNENPFYLPYAAYKEDEISKYQLEIWLKNIFNFNSEKDRFIKEIRQSEEEYNALKEKMTSQIIISMSKLLELHDDYTKGHMENVGKLSKRIAIEMGLSETQVDEAYYAGLIHDIGKAIIPKEILNKKGLLTKEEYDLIKKHPETGHDILQQSPQMNKISKNILNHHERWDGQGYPNGVSGENIPLISRILTAADAFDAMIHDRPYRKALSLNEAKSELVKGSNAQFDKNVVKALLSVID